MCTGSAVLLIAHVTVSVNGQRRDAPIYVKVCCVGVARRRGTGSVRPSARRIARSVGMARPVCAERQRADRNHRALRAACLDGTPPSQAVQLCVGEKLLANSEGDTSGQKPVVVFVHGSSYSSTHAFDLPFKDYSWMDAAVRAGFHVFGMDITGSGRSTRAPQMDDPCNVIPSQQPLIVPSPLEAPCAPSYPYELLTFQSEWDDVSAVVDYLLVSISDVALDRPTGLRRIANTHTRMSLTSGPPYA